MVTLKLRPSDAPTTPPMGGRAPLPAAAGSRGVPTATSNQRVECRAAILARGHCACATRLKAASCVCGDGALKPQSRLGSASRLSAPQKKGKLLFQGKRQGQAALLSILGSKIEASGLVQSLSKFF